MKHLILLLVICIASTGLADPNKNVKCQEYASDFLTKDVRYCLHHSLNDKGEETPQLSTDHVIYFFHGLGGSSESWEEAGYADAFDVLAITKNFPSTTVVSFDTDADSFFSDYDNVPTGPQAYETWFVKEFVPMIEAKHPVCNRRECRAVAGLSMGGFGALKTALRHPEMFFTAAVNCPALAPFSIYAPNNDWMQYFNRHPIGLVQGPAILNGIRNIFPSDEIYQANDPSVLVEKLLKTQDSIPSLYFDMGGKDYFGFQEGYERFKKILTGAKVSFVSYLEPEAGHDIYKTRGINLLQYLSKQFKTSKK